MITTVTAMLSTSAGKAAAGLAIAAASAGGLHAADVVDLPVVPPAGGVEVDETPVDPADVVAQTPAAEHADPQATRESDGEDAEDESEDTAAEETEGEEADGEETEAEETPAGDDVADPEADAEITVQSRTDADGNPAPGVDGASVAADAQDGGVDGAEVSAAARAGTPAEERVPADSGAEDDDASEERGSQADERRPAAAGRP